MPFVSLGLLGLLSPPFASIAWLRARDLPAEVATDLAGRAESVADSRCPFRLNVSAPALWPLKTGRPRVFVYGGVSAGALGPFRSVALLSEDGGASFREVMAPTPGSDVSELARPATGGAEGFALVAFGVESPGPVHVWHSGDGGRTWAAQSLVPKRNPLGLVRDLAFADAQNGTLIVDEDGLGEVPPAQRLATSDAGRSWRVLGPAPVAEPVAERPEPSHLQLPPEPLVRLRADAKPIDAPLVLEVRPDTQTPWRAVSRLPRALRRLRDGRFGACPSGDHGK